MGKRSNFPRRRQDAYQTTDPRAVPAVAPFLRRDGITTFAEPCAGEMHLADALTAAGFVCATACDIAWDTGFDALKLEAKHLAGIDAIITNPPWTRELLHPLIRKFALLKQTWLLFDSDWAYTQQAASLLPMCSDIVPTPRLRWLPGTKFNAKDNTSWYRFDARHTGRTFFHAIGSTI